MNHVFPLVAAMSLAAPLYALDPSGWRYEQAVTCGGGALCCLELSDTTIGTLRPGLEDLRLADASGREVAWLAEESAPIREVKSALPVRPKSVKIELRDRETVLVLETGVGIPIDRVDLESPGVEFLKPVLVEVSQDGETWTVQATGLPVFRRKNGAQNMTLYPGRVCAAFIRLTVDDSASDPVPFTGAGLVTAPTVVRAGSDRRIPVPAARIAAREELAGVTRLRVDLGAANLPLCSLSLSTPEALFMRRVSVRPASGSTAGKVAAVSTVWRVPDSSGGANARLVIPMETVVPTRDIVLEIENGDSPPLAVGGVAAERRPRRIFFPKPEGGRVVLRSGNSLVAAPRYDLAALASRLRESEPFMASATEPVEFSGYKAPRPPVVAGGAFAGEGWGWRRPVQATPGEACSLVTDFETLCRARPDTGDLRLVAAGMQVPYLRESGGVCEATLKSKPMPSPRKGVTRYAIDIPEGAPAGTLACECEAGRFRRHVRLIRENRSGRDFAREEVLAEAEWVRADERSTLTLAYPGAVAASPLILEVEDGENAPLPLRDFRIRVQAERLLFAAPPSGAPLFLYYGNPRAGAPDYGDLRERAAELRAARVFPAEPGAAELTGEAAAITRYSKPIFWGALVVVAIGLVALIARLLPAADDRGSH